MDSSRFTLALAATSATTRLGAVVRFWIKESGIPCRVLATPEGEVLEHLRDADGLLRTNESGLNVVVVRFSDLGTPERARRWITDFGRAAARAHEEGGVGMIVVRIPEAPALEEEWVTKTLDAHLVGTVRAISRAETLTGAAVARALPLADGSDDWVVSVGTLVARRVHAAVEPPHRVLAVACDDVLWAGKCGEVAPEALEVDGHRRSLQAHIRDLARNGWQVCISARNHESDVRRVFSRRPDMPLSLADMAAVHIALTPPSESVLTLSRRLGVSPAEIVLLTAGESECAEVANNLPGVVAVALPENPARIGRFVENLWALDRSPLYLAPSGKREEVPALRAFTPTGQVDVLLAQEGDLERLSDLTFEARHFNATGISVRASELAWFARQPGREVLVVRASGPALPGGMVGALRVRRLRDALRVDDWWMVDSALGRRFEGQILRALGRRAVAAGVAALEIAHVPSRRSEPVTRFIESLGVERSHGECLIPIGVALGAAAHCGVDAAVPGPSESSDFYRRAAGPWSSAKGVARAMTRRPEHAGGGVAPYGLPRTDTERWLAEVWKDLLGVSRVGVHDDFFALGGDSLTAARVMGRITHAFGVQLALRALYEAPTLEAQAGRLASARLAHADPDIVRSLLAEESAPAPA